MNASSFVSRPGAMRSCFAALLLAPFALLGSSIAVLRGQTVVDPSILPLVCLEIATVGTPLVLDSIVFENLETHAEESRSLANTFGRSHPDILTAAAPGPMSLSLPIMKFNPGRYRLKYVVFVGPGTGYSLDLSKGGYWFDVKPACVNYVGGIEINADWANLFHQANRQVDRNDVRRVNVASNVICRDTVHRDVKWAWAEIPGMRTLPSVVSPIAAK
jgi:hypothetical protein